MVRECERPERVADRDDEDHDPLALSHMQAKVDERWRGQYDLSSIIEARIVNRELELRCE